MLGRLLTPITLFAVLASVLVAAPVSASATARRPVPLVTAIATNSPFSPNHDGVKDLGAVRYRLAKSAYVTVRVSRHGTTVLQRSAGRLRAGTHYFVWNGVSNRRVVPDATYTVRVEARRTRHSAPRFTSRALTVEARKGPENGRVAMSSDIVYPRTTVIHDVVVGNFHPSRDFGSTYDPAAFKGTRLQVLDQAGRIIDSSSVQPTVPGTAYTYYNGCGFSWGPCGGFTWDGRDSHGSIVRDGSYRLRLVHGRDLAGNLRIAAPPVTVQVSSTPLVAVTASTSRPADQFRPLPLEDRSGCLGCHEGQRNATGSTRFAQGLSFDSRCSPPPSFAAYCLVSDDFGLPFTGRRTPSDRITITAHGGPTTAGGSDIGSLEAGRKSVDMQGDTTVTLSDVPFVANTEVPSSGYTGLQWSFGVPADGTAYDISSFDVTWTTYAPAP